MDRYILPTNYYDQYGFGSWLKGNVGNLAQTIGGAALTFLVPGGQAAGIGMMAGGIGGMAGSAASGEFKDEPPQIDKAAIVNSRKGEFLTMKKGGKLPEGNATLKDADDFMSMFPEEMAMGEQVEYEHTGNQKLARRIAADHIKDYLKMTGTPGYYTAMKAAGISDELNKMANGGPVIPTIFPNSVNPTQLANVPNVEIGTKVPMTNRPTQSKMEMNMGYYDKLDPNVDYTSKVRAYRDVQGLPQLPETSKIFPAASKGGTNFLTESYAKEGFALPKVNTYTQGNKYWEAVFDNRNNLVTDPNRASRIMDRRSDKILKESIGRKGMLSDRRMREAIRRTGADPYAYAMGGSMEGSNEFLTEYKTGGTHEQNPYGGIPIGGKARVEEGEFRFSDPDTGESYIFSDRF